MPMIRKKFSPIQLRTQESVAPNMLFLLGLAFFIGYFSIPLGEAHGAKEADNFYLIDNDKNSIVKMWALIISGATFAGADFLLDSLDILKLVLFFFFPQSVNAVQNYLYGADEGSLLYSRTRPTVELTYDNRLASSQVKDSYLVVVMLFKKLAIHGSSMLAATSLQLVNQYVEWKGETDHKDPYVITNEAMQAVNIMFEIILIIQALLFIVARQNSLGVGTAPSELPYHHVNYRSYDDSLMKRTVSGLVWFNEKVTRTLFSPRAATFKAPMFEITAARPTSDSRMGGLNV